MKPLSRRLSMALPSLIIVPAMLQLASADFQESDNGDGNLVITSGTNVADSLFAKGAQDPVASPGPYTVLIENGATVTGDASVPGIIGVSVTDYTIENRGNAVSANHIGIVATEAFQLANSGNLVGTSGIDATLYGISVDGITVNNSGTIQGTVANGIAVGDGLTLTNSGTVRGEVNGVQTGELATINNSGNIVGTTGSAVLASSDLELANSGNITGVTAIQTTAGNAFISNSGNITGTGPAAVAIQLGDTAGAGNNTVAFSGNGSVVGNINATGTGNNINVQSGRVFGNITGVENINVLNNGTLIGTGTWDGNINVSSGAAIGAVAQNSQNFNDFGVLNTTGTVTHAAGSSILYRTDASLETTNDGTDATLIRSVAGNYNATNAIIDVSNSSTDFALNNGDRVIVEANGGTVTASNNSIIYEGSGVSVLGNYFSTLSTATGDLVLSIDHNYQGLPGLSENQSSLGSAFDTFMDNEEGLPDGVTNNGDVRQIIKNLDEGTLFNAQDFLALAVAPAEGALGIASSAMNSNYRLHRLTENHLANARNGGEIVTTTHAAQPVRDAKGGLLSSGETTTSTSSVGTNGNLWGAYSYDDQNNNDFLNGGSYDGEAQSFTAGFDYRVAPNFILGILVDGTENDVDIAGATATTESLRGALYGTFGASTGLYVDFLAGYGTHDLDFADATSLQALTTIGFAMGDDHLKHGPYIGAEYQNMDVDGFDYYDLVNVDDFHSDSLRGLVGYRVNANLGTFRPYASVAYAHEFKDDQPSANTSFLGLPFQVKGAEQGSSILVGAGTGIALNQNLVLDLGYRGEFTTEGDGLDTHGGTIGLNYAF